MQVVTADEDASQGFEFITGDYPRTITMGGVHNVRDIGGFMTSYGVRTNQGLMYRGYYIDDKSGGHGIAQVPAGQFLAFRQAHFFPADRALSFFHYAVKKSHGDLLVIKNSKIMSKIFLYKIIIHIFRH